MQLFKALKQCIDEKYVTDCITFLIFKIQSITSNMRRVTEM